MSRRSKAREGSSLVYSTDSGRMCPGCVRPLADCVCAVRDRARAPASADGVVRVGRQTKGRKGAGVTTITGLAMNAVQLAECTKRLKRLCGVGGSVRDGVIELQGDQRDRVIAALEADGHRVKRVGG